MRAWAAFLDRSDPAGRFRVTFTIPVGGDIPLARLTDVLCRNVTAV